MYETFYGFAEKPFNLTPDPKYLYPSQRHTEAVAHLEFGHRERGGFVLITGEVGTGKTTLARYFLSRLDSNTATAFVLYPALTAAELLRTTLEDLRVPVVGTSLKDHVDALHRFLLQARKDGRQVVLLIDEAQDLSPEVLEHVRLISNLETDTEKLIQIVLVGQSELQEMLARRELRQLAQRVTARYHLAPLTRRETEDYVRHRLTVAGGDGKVAFTQQALAVVHKLSGGVPRLINLICDRSLLAGYVRGQRQIEIDMVRQAGREVRGDPPPWRRSRRWSTRHLIAAGVLVGALATLAFWLHTRASAAPPPSSALVPAAPAAAAPAAGALAARDRATVPAAEAAEPSASTSTPVSGVAAAAEQGIPGSAVEVITPAGLGAPATPLDPLLLSLERDLSFQGAVREVQALWGPETLERTVLRTHLDQVRRLNLPVVLEMFHPARRETCYIALLRLEGDQAWVSVGAVGPARVSLRDIDRLWTHQALFLWRDFESLAAADPARASAWARESLSRLGYLGHDPNLPAAVARFQRDAELEVDGVVGSRTLMTLYSLGPYPRPRLDGAQGKSS